MRSRSRSRRSRHILVGAGAAETVCSEPEPELESSKTGRLRLRKGIQLFRRRLRAEGAKPESNNRWNSELGHVCMWVCMVFGILSRTKARSATNEIPKCRSPERALLRHHIIGVRLPTSAARETAKISSAQSQNAREYWQQPTLSSEDGQLAKTANGIVPDWIMPGMPSRVQTDAERRRREAGVEQSKKILSRSCT